ncbi:MAG: NUDIX domain-containing protein [Candidatus Hydrogenedentes bacterium]|nr:NUDIX domain-containing protein [Candidatus Hydrogenedentota bacterium]
MNPAQPRLRAAALIVEGESLLMVRHQKGGRHYWLLPGGGVDQGETVADALTRISHHN